MLFGFLDIWTLCHDKKESSVKLSPKILSNMHAELKNQIHKDNVRTICIDVGEDTELSESTISLLKQMKFIHLIITGKNLESIHDSIGSLFQLYFLTITGTKLKKIPVHIGQLYRGFLCNLDISHNMITKIPKSFSLLSRLKYINLSHNNIGTLPDKFCQMTQLIEIDLSHNKLKSLPKKMGQFWNLEKLDLSHNQIGCLPISMCEKRPSKDVKCYNREQKNRNMIGKLSKLKYLYLQNNEICDMECDLSTMTDLVEIDLSDNKITKFPCIDDLKNLETLKIYANPLEDISDGIGYCHSLKELHLPRGKQYTVGEHLMDFFEDNSRKIFGDVTYRFGTRNNFYDEECCCSGCRD